MSLLSSIILPKLEKELVLLEPEIAEFLLGQLKSIGAELFAWAEDKMKISSNPKAGSNG